MSQAPPSSSSPSLAPARGHLAALRAGGLCLLTGASGHVGANLLARLHREGVRVRLLLREGSDNRALQDPALRAAAVERCFGDLRDPAAVRRAVTGVSHVFHCAARVSTVTTDAAEVYDCNVLGTRNVLRAAREAGCARVVVTGSLGAVGIPRDDPRRPANEDDGFFPYDEHLPYETSKAFVEHECWEAAAQGQDVVVAISCAVLGPHDYKPSRMGRVLLDFAAGRLPAYVPGGFEFVSAEDLAEGHLLALERGRSGHRYIFSTQFMTIDDLMGLFEEITGQPRPPLRLPHPVMALLAHASAPILDRLPHIPRRFTPGAVRLLRLQRRGDSRKARVELGYQPTDLRRAVRAAYDDFVRRGLITAPARPTVWTRWRRPQQRTLDPLGGRA